MNINIIFWYERKHSEIIYVPGTGHRIQRYILCRFDEKIKIGDVFHE